MLHNVKKYDPDERMQICEVCGKEQPLKHCYSLALVYRMPGYLFEENRGAGAYQCPDDQHFACSHEHAFLAAMFCYFEHIHTGPHAASKELQHPTVLEIKKSLDDLLAHVQAGGNVDFQE